MTSIRRSLLIKLAGLFTAAFSVVVMMSYSLISYASESKQRAAAALIRERFAEERDEAMLTQARRLGDTVSTQFRGDRWRQVQLQVQLASAGLLTAGSSPNFHAAMPVLLMQSRGRESFRLTMALLSELRIDESQLLADDIIAGDEWVEISSPIGQVWRSKAVDGTELPLDTSRFRPSTRFDWLFDDDLRLAGRPARRVALKVPVGRSVAFDIAPPRPPGSSKSPPGPRVHGPARDLDPRLVPPVYVQVIWSEAQPPTKLAALLARRDTALADEERQRQAMLTRLRRQFIAVGLGTNLVMLVLAFSLVGYGLSPLIRVSKAVAAVSPSDMRLPIDPATLPVELQPIALRLKAALEDLGRAFVREKRSVADISHELRTPLAAIMATLDVARRKTRSPEEYREAIGDAHRIGKQMSALVDRILLLASLDSGASSNRPDWFDPCDLLQECCDVVRPLAKSHGLEFEAELDFEGVVECDPNKLREAVMNLLHNAVEYNRPGGAIRLGLRGAGAGRWEVSVSDTGIGIAPEHLDKIFERFFRADPSRHQTGVHAGLGLSLVKEYVEQIGGTLRVDSRPGQGTTFTASFRTPTRLLEPEPAR